MVGAVLIFCGAVALVVTYMTVVRSFLRAGEKIDDEETGESQ